MKINWFAVRWCAGVVVGAVCYVVGIALMLRSR